MRSDRRRHLPYGVDGGLPGTPCYNILNPGPDQRILPVMPMLQVPIKSGDVFCHISAGGAGNGDPMERDPAAVAEDVKLDIITADYAADVYGVIFDASGAVDATATAAKRAELRAAQAKAGGVDTAYLAHYLAPLNLGQPRIEGERLFSCTAIAAE